MNPMVPMKLLLMDLRDVYFESKYFVMLLCYDLSHYSHCWFDLPSTGSWQLLVADLRVLVPV